ncbi:CpaF family protein [Demequina lignilytica]|uniref:ATPase, T2SS/T4P/T4SS family n=1 Tax=Demequina lignilytica TaxID=3051663 RepID=A0AB35MH16_9MICO|nr:ATPase, T2SS/T4P/T4SS family [Demequina sp. SYSU T0a273]MDN4483022.1 ATPase, T2SS/T4P/T4SS family [Demequina sp. SYSU T0a273]
MSLFMGGDAVSEIESTVRARVRATGVDPLRDAAAVRPLVVRAIEEWDERALASGADPVVDRVRTERAVLDSITGLGPLQPLLDDPEVEEIWLNSPREVFVARGGRSELTSILLDDETVRALVERMLALAGRRLDMSSPFVDAALPGGERLHVAIPDVTRRHWAVNIRKYVARASHVRDLVALGTVTAGAASFLEAAVESGLTVLVSGGTQAGKTTTLGAMAGAIPRRERVVTCEEVFELAVGVRDWVALQCRQPSLEGTGEITLRRLVKEALRMRPSRLIVGEVREAEALDLLIALNSGVPGMCTIHANSARDALAKLCTLPLLAGDNVSDRFVVPAVASAVDLVVHVELAADGARRVSEILGVPGRAEGGVIETADIFVRRDGALVRASGFPPHPDRFAHAGHRLGELLAA